MYRLNYQQVLLIIASVNFVFLNHQPTNSTILKITVCILIKMSSNV